MVAQNIVMDGLIYPLMFERFIDELSHEGGATFAMLTEFMTDWYAETIRWTNALIKVTASESDANIKLLSEWTIKWSDRLTEALMPIGKAAFAGDGDVAVNEVKQQLLERLSKQGLDL
jgi:phenol hydroxylase P1 protein